MILTYWLTACGNNQATENNRQGNPLPMGYSSNEKHEESGGNANWLNEDNDGPITEIMDHTFGGEGQENNLRGVNNEATRGGNRRNTLFSRDDKNYHGHLNDNNGGARSSYYTAYNGVMTRQIVNATKSVENVVDARAVVHEDEIMVGAVLENRSRENETKTAITRAVKPYLNGKALTIVTDESIFSRIRTIDNTLREGGPKDQIDKDIDNIFSNTRNQGKVKNR